MLLTEHRGSAVTPMTAAPMNVLTRPPSSEEFDSSLEDSCGLLVCLAG